MPVSAALPSVWSRSSVMTSVASASSATRRADCHAFAPSPSSTAAITPTTVHATTWRFVNSTNLRPGVSRTETGLPERHASRSARSASTDG